MLSAFSRWPYRHRHYLASRRHPKTCTRSRRAASKEYTAGSTTAELQGIYDSSPGRRSPSSQGIHFLSHPSISRDLRTLRPLCILGTAAQSQSRKLGTVTMASPSPEAITNGNAARKQVFFFDIDNCLYPKSAKVHDLMADLIDKYFQKHLNLPMEESARLHNEYYRTYGLAIEGLVRHHEIDPLEYNSKVDDALPLEDVIKPRPELKQLLEDIDRSKVKLWLFTNAYVNHAKRVVRLLEVEDKFDGVTYCDYSSVPFVCKPHKDAYVKAMKDAGVENWEDCYFVDDNYNNCVKAQELGWTTAHLVEDDAPVPEKPASQHQIRHLEDLRKAFPQFFKTAQS